jgi:3'(2'), 5'-bisphosphate nucleotidase
VLAPVAGRLYAGALGAGAFVSHGDGELAQHYLEGRDVAASVKAGSSLKFCLLASGEADLYPRFGPTMEWDTAAGHAVLLAAGGRVTDVAGRDLCYGKPGFANPHFVATGV